MKTEAGYRLRNKKNRGYYKELGGQDLWRLAGDAARYETLANAVEVYDRLNRKPKYQGQLEIVQIGLEPEQMLR